VSAPIGTLHAAVGTTLGTTLPLGPYLVLVTVLGLAVGSFLNVVVHRVPAGLSVVSPGSACPRCGHAVRGRDNVPVLSWVLLRGRCRDCAAPIPVRYPAVEAGTAALFALVALRPTGLPVTGACLVVAAAGVALALIDVEHGRLPFPITGTAAALACLSLGAGWAHLAATGRGGTALEQAAPALTGAALWLGLHGGIWLLTAGRGMGLGDVALAPLLGLVVGTAGVGPALVGMLAAFLLGGTVGMTLRLRGSLGRGARLPFGPFMLAGAAVGLFAGDPLAAAYLRLVGLG
jgi:leader peptidase (prepilin peptidase)/N-methyltransferase